MIPEDKLTHDERLRLEALAQSAQSLVGHPNPFTLVERAKVFERYLTDGDVPAAADAPVEHPENRR